MEQRTRMDTGIEAPHVNKFKVKGSFMLTNLR